MAIGRLVRQAKRPYGVCLKMSAVAILGLCFIFIWSMFSSSPYVVTSQRSSFDDIAEPVSANTKIIRSKPPPVKTKEEVEMMNHEEDEDRKNVEFDKRDHIKMVNVTVPVSDVSSMKKKKKKLSKKKENRVVGDKSDDALKLPVAKENGSESDDIQKEEDREEKDDEGEEKEVGVDDEEESVVDGNGEEHEDGELKESNDEEPDEKVEEDETDESTSKKKKKKKVNGPLFVANAHYAWKLCNTRTKYNYIPCIDIEASTGKMQSYRHRERSCPRTPHTCLVPLPRDGYSSKVHWPESKSKIMYSNVAHPKLATFIRKNSWLIEDGEYLTFPQNQSEIKGGVLHYLESIEEMVPDIEWGKNIRIVLDIGCKDSSFGATLLDKGVLTITLGLKDDLVDLAQVALERGFLAIVSPFETRRLPFPSAVFDAIHCSGCSVAWHSNGGKLLLEMNRILRPNGYFIMSTKQDSIEDDEAMSELTASICWNILAHKTDELSDVGVKIYQKPESNTIYALRRKKVPVLCKENENPDAAWYVPLKTCLHGIPESIEQHGTDWPEEWPKRIHTFPDWINDKDKLIADTAHWKAIVDKSYLTGMGIDWKSIRNVMDMKAIYGGFAAALSEENVWVMNVIPIHAPDTLPVIYERGLAGVYHDWCESFGTYPRSYDLLHADHLFSRLKNRCKQPVAIVVEMDRILRPGGWVILREKVEILDSIEKILRSLHWDIRMTYAQDKEGILGAQKTSWRP